MVMEWWGGMPYIDYVLPVDVSPTLPRLTWQECAEKCAEAFNSLPESTIDEICEKLAAVAQKECEEEGFELPALDGPRGILNYCWFNAMYVDMAGKDDETAYAVEGEGEWGLPVGFVIKGGKVIYAGGDYLDYIQNA